MWSTSPTWPRARDLDAVLGPACALANNLGHDLIDALTRAVDLDRTRALALDLARGLDAALHLDTALDLAPTRFRAHDLVDALTCDVDVDVDLDRDLRHAISVAVDLDRDLRHASDLARAFARADDRALSHGAGRRHSKAAQRLVGAAAWMLPPGERPRYAEEFGSELAEIALAGGGAPSSSSYTRPG